MSNKLYPCLWFDGQAKAAAEFYCSVFKDSKISPDGQYKIYDEEVKIKSVSGSDILHGIR